MALEAVLRPAPKREAIRKNATTRKLRRRYKFPTATDHDEDGDGVDPIHDPHRQRMQPPSMTNRFRVNTMHLQLFLSERREYGRV
jgi:hypothetical protein